MKRRMTARHPALWLPLLALIAALVLALPLAGCGGDDEEEGAETTEAVTEATDDAVVTDTTEADAGMTDETAADTGGSATDPEYEVLSDLPDDFPDIPLPADSSVLEVRAAEVPDGSGGTVRAVAAAFESGTAPRDQYDHFKQALQDGGYEILMDQMVEDPVFLYWLSGSTDEVAVIINGGEDPSEFETDFPGAENPFGIAAGPPGSF